MKYLLYNLATRRIFIDGIAVDNGDSFPSLNYPNVVEIRVLEDGTIESFSVSDWMWKAAPELVDFVFKLESYHAMRVAEMAPPPPPTIPVIR